MEGVPLPRTFEPGGKRELELANRCVRRAALSLWRQHDKRPNHAHFPSKDQHTQYAPHWLASTSSGHTLQYRLAVGNSGNTIRIRSSFFKTNRFAAVQSTTGEVFPYFAAHSPSPVGRQNHSGGDSERHSRVFGPVVGAPALVGQGVLAGA